MSRKILLPLLGLSASWFAKLSATIALISVQDNTAGDYPTLVRDYGVLLEAVNLGHTGPRVFLNGIAFTSNPGTTPSGANWNIAGDATNDGLSNPGIDDLFFSELSSTGELTLTYTNLDPAKSYLVQILHGEPRDCCATVYLNNAISTNLDPAVAVPAISIGNGVDSENPPAASDLAIVSTEITGVSEFSYLARSGPGRDAAIAGFQIREVDAPLIPTGAVPFLSEFVAVGNETHQDENNDTPDWIELYNPTGVDWDLGGYHLTDNPANLTKWTFPTTLLQAKTYLVVFASNKNRNTANAELHTNFRLSSDGEYLALVAPDGVTVLSEFAPTFPRQEDGFSYGTDGLAPSGDQGYFGTSTPGSANGLLLTAPLLAPTIDPPCGTFTSSIPTTITSLFPDGHIRYTTDGSTPTGASQVYTRSLTLRNTTHLRARVFDPGTNDAGAIASGHFQRLSPSSGGGLPAPSTFTSNLPIMVVESFNGSIPGPGSTLRSARIVVHNVDLTTGRSSLATPPDACFRIGIRRRGQSSSGFSKPQYRVELRDDNDVDTDYPLLGLPEESDWVFNGPWTDKALIRNPLAFQLGRTIGIQAPGTAHFEMFLSTNGGDLTATEYVGVYVLMEKIKDGRNRTDLDNLEPTHSSTPEITGGYMLRFEPPGIANDGPRATNWTSVEIIEPDGPTLTQQRWIGRYLDRFVTTLGWRRGQGANNSGVPNSDPLSGYPSFIDVDSFVSLFIINELLREQDSYVRSDYMSKDREGLLHKGPLWDYNLTAGTGCCFDNRNTSGWQYQNSYNRGGRDHSYEPDWFVPLMRCPDFRQRVIDRWAELRTTGILGSANFDALINSLADPLAESAVRNFTKWNILSSGNVGFPTPSTNTWEQQIIELKRWLRLRIRWIDQEFPTRPIILTPSGSWPAGTTLDVIVNSSRTIYFTTDGSDPRLPGGDINPSAQSMSGGSQISISTTTDLLTRTLDAGDWSAPVSATYVIGTPADATNLLVTELNYHPSDPSNAEILADPTYRDDDFEFIEFRNISAGPIDLSGASLIEGINFTIPAPAIVQAGAFALLVENRAAFEERYGSGLPVLGVYSNKLKNDGDSLRMLDVSGNNIFQFTFNDIWFPPTDGNGYSLLPLDEGNLPTSYDHPASWAISCQLLGNPGALNGSLHTQDFLGWRNSHFTAAEIADPLISGSDADLDSDGLTTLMEFALGLDPKSHDAGGTPSDSIVQDNGHDYLSLTFKRWQKAPGLHYSVEVSSDLVTWAPAGEIVAVVDLGDGRETVTIRDNLPISSTNTQRFLRLVVAHL
jgi:hypothetical protein